MQPPRPRSEQLAIRVSSSATVSGLLLKPERPRAGFVLAHGAGAGMRHPFMTAVAEGLYRLGIATLRYQFPYMEAGSRRPDAPPVAHAAVRAAVDEAHRRLPELPWIAGGKSFGGRMTSQAQAEAPMPHVRGLAFLGFPLHPAGKPDTARARHLSDVGVPLLFLQGERDALADAALLRQAAAQLGDRATLVLSPDADHSFHVPARSGRTDAQVLGEALDHFAEWLTGILER